MSIFQATEKNKERTIRVWRLTSPNSFKKPSRKFYPYSAYSLPDMARGTWSRGHHYFQGSLGNVLFNLHILPSE